MKVKELMDVLTNGVKKCDRENAVIQIRCGEQEYEIKGIRGYTLSPDVVVEIVPITSSMFKPMTFKKEHMKMVDKKIKEITGGKK